MAIIFNSPTLDKIGISQNTDKSSIRHDALRKYEFFMKPWRDEEFTILELGVYTGSPLATWREYFPKADIIGVDRDDRACTAIADRVNVIVGDLGDAGFLGTLKPISPAILIDDASHMWRHQLMAFFELFPTVEPGGLYILEDIGTSFAPAAQNYSDGEAANPFTIMQALSDHVTANEMEPITPITEYQGYSLAQCARDIDAVTFISNSCIIVKKPSAGGTVEKNLSAGRKITYNNVRKVEYKVLKAVDLVFKLFTK